MWFVTDKVKFEGDWSESQIHFDESFGSVINPVIPRFPRIEIMILQSYNFGLKERVTVPMVLSSWTCSSVLTSGSLASNLAQKDLTFRKKANDFLTVK